MTDDTKAAAGWTKAKLYAEMKKVTRERDEAQAAYASTREASIAQVNFANAEAQRFQAMLLEAKAANASVAARQREDTAGAACAALTDLAYGAEEAVHVRDGLMARPLVTGDAPCMSPGECCGEFDGPCPRSNRKGDAPRAVPVERVRELMQQAHGLGLQHVKLDALLKEVES